MKIIFTFSLILLSIGLIFAQGEDFNGPYPRITEGYGSFGTHPVTEIKITNTYAFDKYGNHPGDEITIRYASDINTSMPTVLFAPGYAQYEPELFDTLLNFIASKGFAVVHVPYKASGITEDNYGDEWGNIMYNGMNQAIDAYPNIIDKTRLGFFGHSSGAGYIFWLGKKFYMDKGYGQNAKFLFSVAGWIGFQLTREDLANYPSDCKLLVQIWDEDDHISIANHGNTSPRIQYDLFQNINIPTDEKNYTKVMGGFDNNGYHYSTEHELVITQAANADYNALDYYAIFRPLDAMMDYTFNGNINAKTIALGFNPNMGPFPALDIYYDYFVFLHDESTYDYPCDVSANPHREFCPDAPPLGIELESPFVARQVDQYIELTWATANEYQNQGFDIQRSDDEIHWHSIGWVEGHGTTNTTNIYQAIDRQPKLGLNFYRFEQFDFDGNSIASNVVKVVLTDKSHFVLAPNPAKNQVNILSSSNTRILQVAIQTLTGKTVQIIKNPSNSIDISSLSPGVYLLSIQSTTGVTVKKLVKE